MELLPSSLPHLSFYSFYLALNGYIGHSRFAFYVLVASLSLLKCIMYPIELKSIWTLNMISKAKDISPIKPKLPQDLANSLAKAWERACKSSNIFPKH